MRPWMLPFTIPQWGSPDAPDPSSRQQQPANPAVPNPWQYGNPSEMNTACSLRPVYAFSDGQSHALFPTIQPTTISPAYHAFQFSKVAFYISPVPARDTPTPLYWYVLEKANGQFNHFYTKDANEIGVTEKGARGNYGYECRGILGYVGDKSDNEKRLVPVYRWYSSQENSHLFSLDPNKGDSLNRGYRLEGTMGWVHATCQQ